MPPSLPEAIGKYTIERFIESGGMGDVYLARDPALDRAVAIKFLREGFDNQEMRERFEREARAAGRLSHPNIVTIYEFGIFDGRPFIAMEFVRGEPLSKLIRRREPIPLVRKLEMMEGLCSGLAHAHKTGMVHRDIKPANLMVDNDGGPLKILDFGIVRMAGSGLTSHGVLVGTINYMSPEQITGRGTIDLRSDVFAVGAVLHEVFTYQRAFPGEMTDVLYKIVHAQPESAATLSPGLDPGIVRAIDQCLEKTPERRYQDLGVLRRELARIRQRLELEESETYGHSALTHAPAEGSGVALQPSERLPPDAGLGHAAAVDATLTSRRRRPRRRRRRRPPIAPAAPRRPPRISRARNGPRRKRASSWSARPRSRRGSRPSASSRSGRSRNGPSGRGSPASGRQAEQARLERQHAERVRAEQARAEQARIEQARQEQARLEQARLDKARAEEAERARVERERLEQARLEEARQAREQAEKERAEAQRKAEAEAKRQAEARREQRQRDLAQAQKDVAAGRFAEAAGLLRPWAAESAGDAAFAAVLKQAEAGLAKLEAERRAQEELNRQHRLGQRAGRAAGLRRRQPHRAGGPRRAPESHARRRTSSARSHAASSSGPGPPPSSSAPAACSTPAPARRWSCWSGSRRRTASWTARSPTCASATRCASASGCAARSRRGASSRSRPSPRRRARSPATAPSRAARRRSSCWSSAIASWSTIFPPKPIAPADRRHRTGEPTSAPRHQADSRPDRQHRARRRRRPPAPARAPAETSSEVTPKIDDRCTRRRRRRRRRSPALRRSRQERPRPGQSEDHRPADAERRHPGARRLRAVSTPAGSDRNGAAPVAVVPPGRRRRRRSRSPSPGQRREDRSGAGDAARHRQGDGAASRLRSGGGRRSGDPALDRRVHGGLPEIATRRRCAR